MSMQFITLILFKNNYFLILSLKFKLYRNTKIFNYTNMTLWWF